MGCALHRSLDVSYWNIGHELSDPGSLEIKVSGIRICGWLRTDCVVVMKGGTEREEVVTEMVVSTKVVIVEVVGVDRLQIYFEGKVDRICWSTGCESRGKESNQG